VLSKKFPAKKSSRESIGKKENWISVDFFLPHSCLGFPNENLHYLFNHNEHAVNFLFLMLP
jgi:hypothetical protein